jgi:hypothetical protein
MSGSRLVSETGPAIGAVSILSEDGDEFFSCSASCLTDGLPG